MACAPRALSISQSVWLVSALVLQRLVGLAQAYFCKVDCCIYAPFSGRSGQVVAPEINGGGLGFPNTRVLDPGQVDERAVLEPKATY